MGVGCDDCCALRGDALFELTGALLRADGPVISLPELSLTGEHRRGNGALYDGLAAGRIDIGRLRRCLADLPIPRDTQGRITLAVHVVWAAHRGSRQARVAAEAPVPIAWLIMSGNVSSHLG